MILLNNKAAGCVPFRLTIELTKIKGVSVNNLDRLFSTVEHRIHTWSKGNFESKKTTIKHSHCYQASEFNDGETQHVLIIDGHMYMGRVGGYLSDEKAVEAIKDLETYLIGNPAA